jgi:hypothetical protein
MAVAAVVAMDQVLVNPPQVVRVAAAPAPVIQLLYPLVYHQVLWQEPMDLAVAVVLVLEVHLHLDKEVPQVEMA